MARAATSRIKFNAPLGRRPVLQFLRPAELQVDPTYQRSLETAASQALIRKIAQHWNWDLCQPLVVARRAGGALFVIDGQHRLEAARLRGDIDDLPSVVLEYADPADEAASFVHLNQQRRPLGKLDLFKAALASEDGEAAAIVAAITEAGLSVAPHSNFTAWKPGMVSNIGGIQSAWRQRGADATSAALRVLARAFPGQVLRYAGTIFPGIVSVCADEGTALDEVLLAQMLAGKDQTGWRQLIMECKARNPGLRFSVASASVIARDWARLKAGPVADAPRGMPARTPALPAVKRDLPVAAGGKGGQDWYDLREKSGARWYEQCEALRKPEQVQACTSRFCKLADAA